MEPSTIQGPGDIEAQNIVTGKHYSTINNNSTTLKFYDTVWKMALIHARSLSCVDAIINNVFSK